MPVNNEENHLNEKNPMKQIFLLLSLLFSVSLVAQKTVLTGKVIDKETKEELYAANVVVGPGVGTITDLDGNYTIELENGEYTVTASYIGLANSVEVITLKGGTQNLNFELGLDQMLEEITVTADIAIERETPVAFSNIPTIKLNEELAAQDLPMVLNSTPGVYATESGGGDGDARITIRGFNQRNVAVMLDGIPVNDMENGWVYWSNWFGLDLVTKTMQVQRGLGASKLAIPSVGGTINILTKGIESKRNVSFKQEVGNNGYLRSTFGYTSGRLDNGFGISVAGSYKRGDGWVQGNFTEGYFYYLRVDKDFGKHLISASAFGAPQKHGQRAFKVGIAETSADYAKEMFEGTEEEYDLLNRRAYLKQRLLDLTAVPLLIDEELVGAAESELSSVNSNLEQQGFVDESGNLIETNSLLNNFVDTIGAANNGLRFNEHVGIRDGKEYNTRQNYYHKPQFSIRHSWTPNPRFFVSNVAYLSIGSGGGIAPDGTINYEDIGNSSGILRTGINNHFWYGLLSTTRITINEVLNFSGGIDLRDYQGEHYREVRDLLGSDSFLNNGNTYGEGEIFDYNQTGLVRWAGLFGLLELKKNRVSAFLNLSGSYSGYGLQDDFKDFTLDYVWLPGYTAKTGASFKINDTHNVFGNVGFLSKPQRWSNVIQSNRFIPGPPVLFRSYDNEEILAFEVGYGFKSQVFSANVNAYNTLWNNKPLDNPPTELEDPEDPTSNRIPINVFGIKALHQGVEVDFVYKFNKRISIEGLGSIGDWVWNSTATAIKNNGDTLTFDAKGVHVGDAAQLQIGGLVRVEPMKNLYFKLKGTYFGKNYSNFTIESLQGGNAGKESWKIPDYSMFSFHTGYRFKIKDVKVDARLNLLNLFNAVYITDATNNAPFLPGNKYNFDAASAEVFFGQGFRWSTSLRISL